MINEEWQKRIDEFNTWDNDMIIPGKLTNDGAHNVWIEETRNPRGKRRKKYAEPKIKVDVMSLETAKNVQQKKEVIEENADTESRPPGEEIKAENDEIAVDFIDIDKEDDVDKDEEKTPQETRLMTLREVFDELYDSYYALKFAAKKKALLTAMAPYFDTRKRVMEFVEENLHRRRHNNGARYLRALRKCCLNRFNYFVTFTYDDEKMDREQFKKKLKAYLKNKVNRDNWKYFGVWEGWDGKKRLHFHALMYIPEGTMPGELVEMTSYNTSKKRKQTVIANTEFNEKFGRSSIEEIIVYEQDKAYNYVLKYLNKGGKSMVSKNCPTFIKGYVQKSQLVFPMKVEHKYFMNPHADVIMLTGEITRVDEERPQEALPNATTCN